MTEERLRELFKATNTAEPLCEGWPGLLRFGLAVAEAEREATLDKVLAGLRSENDSTQLRAIIASVEAMRSNGSAITGSPKGESSA